jgi:Bacteriophage related domain of unknown function
MSEALVRTALQTQLATVAAVAPALPVALENVNFVPPAPSSPYMVAYVLWATPENREMGRGHFLLGLFQVNCVYPLGGGTAPAVTRALLVKAAFPKGATFTSGGVNAQVTGIPAIGNGSSDGVMWSLPVKIPVAAWMSS